MKRFTALFAVLCVLMMTFAACGQQQSQPTAAPTQAASDEEAAFTGTLEDKKDFMITVTGEDGVPYVFNLDGVPCPAEVGQTVTVTYTGDITDFDAQLTAVRIEKVN